MLKCNTTTNKHKNRMRTYIRRFVVLLMPLMVFATTQVASAFYDPSLQRWINRDPLGEEGSLVYTVSKIEPRMEPRTAGDLAQTVALLENPLEAFARINLNPFAAMGNNPVSNIDPFGLDFASCYADCIENNRSPVARCVAHLANAAGNALAGPTGRSGFQGVKSHPTSWQHKVGSKLGSVGSKVGRFAGRAAVAATIADGFHDLGLLGGCAAACAGE